MSTFFVKLIGSLLALGALAASTSYIRTLRLKVVSVDQQLADARRGIAVRDSTIEQVHRSAVNQATQHAQFNRAQDAIASKLAAARFENRRLTNENALLRAWTDTRLPDNVVRMHTSPPLTGADDYLERMPSGDSVRAASDGAANER